MQGELKLRLSALARHSRGPVRRGDIVDNRLLIEIGCVEDGILGVRLVCERVLGDQGDGIALAVFVPVNIKISVALGVCHNADDIRRGDLLPVRKHSILEHVTALDTQLFLVRISVV